MSTPAHDADYARGHDLFQSFVRGDAVAGLMSDVFDSEKRMMDALWTSAARNNPAAWTLIADAHIARVQAIGAFYGVDVDEAREATWPEAVRHVVDADNPSLQCALRAWYQASLLGDREATLHFAKMSRHSSEDNQRIARDALAGLADPSPAELYRLGLVHNWLGEMEASAKAHIAAAERGDADAQFELYIYFLQGVGVPADAGKAKSWLERAAAANHPRALFNIGARYASGEEGEPDKQKAAEWYERAAKHGSARAAATLGVMILTREIDGTREQCVAWLDQADDGGYPSWQALDFAGVDDPREEAGEPGDEDEASDDDS